MKPYTHKQFSPTPLVFLVIAALALIYAVLVFGLSWVLLFFIVVISVIIASLFYQDITVSKQGIAIRSGGSFVNKFIPREQIKSISVVPAPATFGLGLSRSASKVWTINTIHPQAILITVLGDEHYLLGVDDTNRLVEKMNQMLAQQ